MKQAYKVVLVHEGSSNSAGPRHSRRSGIAHAKNVLADRETYPSLIGAKVIQCDPQSWREIGCPVFEANR